MDKLTTNKSLRNFVFIFFGIILMGFMVTAQITITDRDITLTEGQIIGLNEINLTGSPLIISDSTNNKIIAIFNDDLSDVISRAFTQPSVLFGGAVSSFFGDVNNFDDVNAFSRFKEVNINNGTNASAGFIGINNINHSISIGIGSSNFQFMNLSLENIGAIRLKSPADMFFINDFIRGWFWVADQNDTVGFTDPRSVMDLDAFGNLKIIGNFTALGSEFSIGGVSVCLSNGTNCLIPNPFDQTLNITSNVNFNDVNSQGLFNRIDNVTEINLDTIFNLSLPVLYVADTTNNEININITFGTNASFQVWDAKKTFNSNSVFVNILNSDGITIDHSAELDTKDKAFQFYFNGTFWNYGQIGKGQFIEISSPHNSTGDFGNLVEENNNNTELTIIGSLEFVGSGVGSQKIISIVPTSVLTSSANWKGVFIDGAALDPTGEGADIVGFEVDFSGLNTTNNPVLHGVEITVPPRFDAMHIHEGQLVIDNKPTSVETSEFSAMDIRVDTVNLNSTSVWSAMGVTAVGSSTGTIAAVLARNQVDPIRQEVGTFTSPSQTEFAGRKTGGGSVWADGIDGVEIFIVNGDEVYIGSTSQFSQIEVIMGIIATKDIQPTFHYSIGADTWTEFFPDDETSGFQTSSLISWEPDSISALWTNTGDPGGAESTAGFWIKIIRVRNADPGTPTPTTMKTGTVVALGWDSLGLITINDLDVSNNVSIGGNITLGEKITFALGEMIDNLVDGWVRITGNLNVTGNIETPGNLTVDVVKDNTIFAQLSSSVDQIPANVSSVPITYDLQDGINGINHSTSILPGEITINTAGMYFISPQPQVGKDMGATAEDFDMYLQVDRGAGFVNEPNSNIKLSIKDQDLTDVIILAFTISLDSGDKIRMMQKVSDAGVGMGLKNTNATAEVPRTPSIIFTMYRIGGQP